MNKFRNEKLNITIKIIVMIAISVSAMTESLQIFLRLNNKNLYNNK